jgi:uncharacterized protein
MAKFLLLLVIGLLVGLWVAKRYRKRSDARDAATPRRDEDMVRCAKCGVHLPRSESIMTRGSYYCSPEHERQHERAD